MKGSPLSPLAAAAEALDAEVGRYEALAAGVGRERLDSEKSLRRAVQTLRDLEGSEARLGTHLESLGAALADVRRRQQEQAEAVRRRADEIGARSDRLGALLGRWQALGDGARELNQLVRAFDGATEHAQSASTLLADLDERLARLTEDAAELTRAVESDGFADLARQADGLRMQLVAVRNKLRLMQDRYRPASD